MSSFVDLVEKGGIAATGALVSYAWIQWRIRKNSRQTDSAAQQLLDQARQRSEALLREAKLTASEEALKLHEQTEEAIAKRRTERLALEARLTERESLINTQLQRVLETENNLSEEKKALRKRLEALETREQSLAQLLGEAREALHKLAGLSQTQARETLLKQVEQDALQEANNLTRQIVETAKVKAEEKARRIISIAIQRYAGDHTFENTTATIALPNGEDIKGRIIGREGRNIRAFEAATGVTVLIDDTPGAVLLSGFDPVRREIAREAMLQLVTDGRIHPGRIEEVVAAVSQEMDQTIVRLGEEAVAKAGLPPMAADVVKILGRLHFRHSFSQNILDHSVEVAHLMGLMAAELGLDVMVAKRSGLLHDIGKAINHEVEGPHAVVGADLIKRYGESDEVVNAVASHHNDVPPIGPMGILVSAADAISASRPGARSESMTTYLKRVEDLEKIAGGFPGVERAFAVQAGRELRVFVQPDQIDDDAAYNLARNVASKIENELQYPGQIRITVIRETRCVEVAK